MVSVTEAVKESLVGSKLEPGLSVQSKRSFEKFASESDGEGNKFMTKEDFVDAIAPATEDYHKIKREQYAVLFQVADRNHNGKIDIQEWTSFEHLLQKPDAEYEIAFRLFDVEGRGSVAFDDFVKIFKENKKEGGIPFNFKSDWVKLYCGGNGDGPSLTYENFSQLLKGLQGERVRQAFRYFDKKDTGFISLTDFEKMVHEIYGHKLSDSILQNVRTIGNLTFGKDISYAHVRAFQNLVREMDMVEVIIRNATTKSPDGRISKTDFLNEAAKLTRFSLFTPMETNILFHFAGLDDTTGRLQFKDFAKVLDPSWTTPEVGPSVDKKLFATPSVGGEGSVLTEIANSAYNFALGSIAGAFGATVVYPIDLVKTRMQNQRSNLVGQTLYTNSWDCAKKVVRHEGFRGLYSGLLPQLVGVAPEKAIKLTVNQLMREAGTDKNGNISLPWELLSGGMAGGCQVVFTNPLEIVKIRLQVQGEVARSVEGAPRRSAGWIIKNLGIVGLYKGASACLMRDVPFSAIYFPAYAHLKKDFFGESPEKKLGILQLLTAGAIAGMPAAYFTTPFDVIKTRIQVEARKGQTSYTGIGHCASSILKEEGFKAFFKGGPARILRSSPQFGCTLAAFELLQTTFPFPGHRKDEKMGLVSSTQPGLAPKPASSPLGFLRSRNALKILLDMDSNFGTYKVPESFGAKKK